MDPVSQKFFPTVAALLFGCFIFGAFSAVLQYPRSKVALLGDSVSFTCKGQGDGTLLVDNLSPVGDKNVNQKLLADNITWNKQEHGDGNSMETTFTVTAVATTSNNGTFIWCGFEYHGSTSSTDDVFLIVVTGPPEPPGNFELQTTNMTALSLTWTAPIPHIINNYTVTMLNLTSSKVTQWTTTDTHFMVMRGKEDNCHRLQFIVTALTDVGSSNTPTIEKGFPKGMTNLNQNSVFVETLQRANGTLKIEPKFEIPERCSYERHLYSFAIKNVSTEVVVGNINTTIPHMVFGGGIQPGTDYQLVIGVHNEAGMSVSAEKNFNSGFNKKQTCITTTPPPQLPPVTIQDPVESDSQSLVLASSGALGAVILLLVMLLFVLLGLLIHSRRSARTKRQTVCAIDEVTIGQEHANSRSTTAEKPKNLPIPRTMATNPMYEASTPIYDFVPEGKELRNLSPDASCQQANHPSLPVDIPPQLPVRKPTLDSPQGVKSTAQLVLDKMAPPVSPSVNEEYMYMKAIDPRYSRPPASLERIKKEELILSPTENKKE